MKSDFTCDIEGSTVSDFTVESTQRSRPLRVVEYPPSPPPAPGSAPSAPSSLCRKPFPARVYIYIYTAQGFAYSLGQKDLKSAGGRRGGEGDILLQASGLIFIEYGN